MEIIFFHGKDSSPGNEKAQALLKVIDQQPIAINVYQTDHTYTKNPDQRLKDSIKEYQDILSEKNIEESVVLVGSSMGGYVATALSNQFQVRGLFLMAPALFMPEYEVQNYKPKVNILYTVHGKQDNIVPIENTRKFNQNVFGQRSTDKIIETELEDGHRLHNSISEISKLFEKFLKDVRENYAASCGAIF